MPFLRFKEIKKLKAALQDEKDEKARLSSLCEQVSALTTEKIKKVAIQRYEIIWGKLKPQKFDNRNVLVLMLVTMVGSEVPGGRFGEVKGEDVEGALLCDPGGGPEVPYIS